jgi:hypothetical protein
LREEYRLRVFENRALRRIFWPKRDEVTGEWRILRNEERYALYATKYHSDDETTNTEMGSACSAYGEEKRCIQDMGA